MKTTYTGTLKTGETISYTTRGKRVITHLRVEVYADPEVGAVSWRSYSLEGARNEHDRRTQQIAELTEAHSKNGELVTLYSGEYRHDLVDRYIVEVFAS